MFHWKKWTVTNLSTEFANLTQSPDKMLLVSALTEDQTFRLMTLKAQGCIAFAVSLYICVFKEPRPSEKQSSLSLKPVSLNSNYR